MTESTASPASTADTLTTLFALGREVTSVSTSMICSARSRSSSRG